jgi:nicotinate-nucleotide adenylyltransferase
MDEARAASRRVAFFGGSFDPPHLGHLAVARAARAALSLDNVLFAPVGAQPLKPAGSVAGFEHRVAMTRLALAGEPGFELSLADAPRPSGLPNYTLETLQAIQAELAPGSTLFCLMGADAFVGLKSWRGAARIPFVAPLIVASRPGLTIEDLKMALPQGLIVEVRHDSSLAGRGVDLRCWLLHNAAGETAPFYLLPGLHVDVSASEIRRQLGPAVENFSVGPELLPPAVAEYIRTHRLYC